MKISVIQKTQTNTYYASHQQNGVQNSISCNETDLAKDKYCSPVNFKSTNDSDFMKGLKRLGRDIKHWWKESTRPLTPEEEQELKRWEENKKEEELEQQAKDDWDETFRR